MLGMKTQTLKHISVQSRRHENTSGHSSNSSNQVRSIFISDVHLGTKDCKAKQLNAFLSRYSCEKLYLVGDIFDGWKMQKGVFWTRDFNKVIRRILKFSKQGTEITYITGNHDEFLRKYSNLQFDNIKLCNRSTHTTVTGDHFLVVHGDQFEGVARCSKLLKFIGNVGYGAIMNLNRWHNILRSKLGFEYWSFAGFLKDRLPKAKSYIAEYENVAAQYAKKHKFKGVVCGHIHQASHRIINGVEYINTGDWVESCTALVEHSDGRLELIKYSDSGALTETHLDPATYLKASQKHL